MKIILGEKYKSYDQALNVLDIETLDERREGLCLKFAIKSSKHEKTSKMFPINIKKLDMDTRNPEQFKVQFSRTERLKNCSVIFMQNALNKQC